MDLFSLGPVMNSGIILNIHFIIRGRCPREATLHCTMYGCVEIRLDAFQILKTVGFLIPRRSELNPRADLLPFDVEKVALIISVTWLTTMEGQN
jgi:hypothetical protein